MKVLKLIILFTIVVKIAYPQKKISFHYLLNERITTPKSKVPLLGMEQEFVTERKYYTPVVFSETRLFTGDNKKSILFKINKRIWYYKSGKEWRLFYNYNKMAGGTILLLGIRYKVSFKKDINIRNTILHKIIMEPIRISQSHKLEYFFDKNKGVIIIQSGSAILLRSDSFKNPLTEDEIDML